jgi:hypothetical protein
MTTDEAGQVESRTASESRALVALAAATAAAPPRPRHRQAPFLAQLIATKQQHPQTRERRRAEPAQAVSAYRAAAKLAKWG